MGAGVAGERSSLLVTKLSAARDYSTFLLGMTDHDPPAVVIPSKGRVRLQGQQQQHDHPSDTGEEEHDDRPRNGASNNGLNSTTQATVAIKSKDEWTPWSAFSDYFKNYDLTLDNVGSVARDHLANERTFLAWLRTSLSLASIGVAITQLFRLSSSSYTLPPQSVTADGTSITSAASSVPTIAAEDLPSIVSALLATVQKQQQDIMSLGISTAAERGRYQKLGKPIGGTFLILGIVFMMLGGRRYITIQHHLVTKNHFAPARRSILISSFLIMALLIAAFGSILAIKES